MDFRPFSVPRPIGSPVLEKAQPVPRSSAEARCLAWAPSDENAKEKGRKDGKHEEKRAKTHAESM